LACASLRLRVFDLMELPDLVPRLKLRLNQPRWPAVEIAVEGDTLSCKADTWDPLLRVRIEDAISELFGSAWRDSVEWM
jgi:hypothetical protein